MSQRQRGCCPTPSKVPLLTLNDAILSPSSALGRYLCHLPPPTTAQPSRHTRHSRVFGRWDERSLASYRYRRKQRGSERAESLAREICRGVAEWWGQGYSLPNIRLEVSAPIVSFLETYLRYWLVLD
ncbi:hypothetical protein J6590_056384 [Homalodisca vitripennis]|nr:hypothetical protein J6590_056384 [Homalodisca vitripennis]